MADDEDPTQAISITYQKLLPNCKLSTEPVDQKDYDLTVQYLKSCFPKTSKSPKNIEQTLKRVS